MKIDFCKQRNKLGEMFWFTQVDKVIVANSLSYTYETARSNYDRIVECAKEDKEPVIILTTEI